MHKYEEQIVHPELDKPTEVEKVLTVDRSAARVKSRWRDRCI